LHQYVTAFTESQKDPEGAPARWVMKSGVEAGRMAESLQDWDSALKVYKALKDLLPGMAPLFDKKIAKASEHH